MVRRATSLILALGACLTLADWSVTQVTPDPDHEDNDPSWRGDGDLIGTTARLMIMEADGSNPRELLPPSVYAEHVSKLEWFDW